MTKDSDYIGIDYGMGKTNRDENFHFGVINQNEVLQSWADSSEAIYPDPETCETCNGTGKVYNEETDENDPCEDCEDGTIENDMIEAIGFEYSDEGYQASCGEDGDIFITKSPYFTYCMYCSPCAPGAGYLMSPNPAGIMTYCFGHDWFDSGKAPYPVYDVTNGTEVKE